MEYLITNLRYIVFIIDSKYKDHSGKVFCNLQDANVYAKDLLNDNYGDKMMIGMFYEDSQTQEKNITYIKSIGFTGDKKIKNQLSIF